MSKKKIIQKAASKKKDQQLNKSECCCTNEKSSTSIQYNKNRVTIFGQVGQTANNNYTLEYAAKINDTPISPEFFSEYYNYSSDKPEHNDKNFKEVASHAVQVNIREHWERSDKRKTASTEQAVQCNFESMALVLHDQNNDIVDGNVLKKCKSPVVVISVYPRTDVEINAANTLTKSQPTSSKYSSNVVKVEHIKKSKEKKDLSQNRRIKSRSASPVGKKVDKLKTGANLSPKKDSRLKIKSSSNLSPPKHKAIKIGPQKDDKSCTKEMKKTLIDNFIKSIESEDDNYAKFLLSIPKSSASKITIDLNKNKKHYGVVLDSDNKGVEIENQNYKFKGPTKAVAAKIFNDSNISEPRPEKDKFIKMNMRNSFSKSMQVKARDSIVINHSRERRNTKAGLKNINSINKSGNSGSRTHYRGDDCPIDDPNERDKEIQQLLGLKKKKNNTSLAKTSQTVVKQCGSFKKCSKTIIISVNRKRQPRSSYTQRDHGDQNYDTVHKEVKRQQKLIIVKNRPRTTEYSDTNKQIYKVPNSYSHRTNKGTKIITNQIRNHHFDYVHSELQVLPPKLICDYDFFHAQKPHRYRKNKLPIKRYSKTTMTTKNTANFPERNQDVGHCLFLEGSEQIKQAHKMFSDRKNQTENNNPDKYAQTEKNFRNSRHMKMVRNSHYKIKNNNKLLRTDSEQIIEKNRKSTIIRSTVSAMEISNNYNLKLESKLMPKKNFNQKGDGLDLINTNKQIDHGNSVHIIYKGHKRSVTPNLGTSFVSTVKSSTTTVYRKPRKRRKTLWHILSCLIKKMHRKTNIPKSNQNIKKSTTNTIDSYYINSSLAPWDMSSVIFDTSASFYSSHSLHAYTNIKRGFFTLFCDFFIGRNRYLNSSTINNIINKQ